MTPSGLIDLYCYLDGGVDAIEAFCATLQARHRARLDAKIDALEVNGFQVLLGSKLLTDTRSPHIKEIVLNSREIAVRILCCRGPVNKDREVTLLYGCFERNRKYEPKDALDIAEQRRQAVISNPLKRRTRRG